MKIFKKNNARYKAIVKKALDANGKEDTKANDEEAVLTLTETEIQQLKEFLDGNAEIEVVTEHEGLLTEEEVITLKDLIPALVELVGDKGDDVPEEEEEDIPEEDEDNPEEGGEVEGEEEEEVFAEDEKIVCGICEETITGWPNNGAPVVDGDVCDKCNQEKVIPARMAEIAARDAGASTKDPDAGTGAMVEVEEDPEEEKAEDEKPKRVFVKKTLNTKATDRRTPPKRRNPNGAMFRQDIKANDAKEPEKRSFDFHTRG